MAIYSVIPSGNAAQYQDLASFPAAYGYSLAVTGAETFTLTPGVAKAYNSDFMIGYPGNQQNVPAEITVDISTVGPNGCYPFAISSALPANKTLYPVYICGDGNLNKTTCAVVATAGNFVPAGYTAFRRIGYIYVDTAGEIIPMLQTGQFTDRTYQLSDAVIALTTGTETGATKVSLQTGDLMVPSTASTVNLILQFEPSVISDFAYINAFGQTSTTWPIQYAPGIDNDAAVNVIASVGLDDGEAAVQYAVTAGVLNAYVAGFTDQLAI